MWYGHLASLGAAADSYWTKCRREGGSPLRFLAGGMRTRLMVQIVKEAVALVQMEKVVVGALLVGEGVPTTYGSGFHRYVDHLEAVEGRDEKVVRARRHASVCQLLSTNG